MKSIDDLLPHPGATIYDRETMMRELLATKVNQWLDYGKFYLSDLRTMREIARDISGLEKEALSEVNMPTDIERLQRTKFQLLIPVVRRECILQCLNFVGINENSAADLLGAAEWQSVLAKIDALGESPSVEEEHVHMEPTAFFPTFSVDTWTTNAILSKICSMLDSGHFSICAVDTIARSLRILRDTRGEANISRPEDVPQYAGLQALHCVDYAAMEPQIRHGLRGAILTVLGLDEESSTALLGHESWARIQALFESSPLAQQAQVKVRNDAPGIEPAAKAKPWWKIW